MISNIYNQRFRHWGGPPETARLDTPIGKRVGLSSRVRLHLAANAIDRRPLQGVDATSPTARSVDVQRPKPAYRNGRYVCNCGEGYASLPLAQACGAMHPTVVKLSRVRQPLSRPQSHVVAMLRPTHPPSLDGIITLAMPGAPPRLVPRAQWWVELQEEQNALADGLDLVRPLGAERVVLHMEERFAQIDRLMGRM